MFKICWLLNVEPQVVFIVCRMCLVSGVVKQVIDSLEDAQFLTDISVHDTDFMQNIFQNHQLNELLTVSRCWHLRLCLCC